MQLSGKTLGVEQGERSKTRATQAKRAKEEKSHRPEPASRSSLVSVPSTSGPDHGLRSSTLVQTLPSPCYIKERATHHRQSVRAPVPKF